MSLVNQLMLTFKRKISRIVLVPSDGGRFELTVGDELVYSKLATGEFPDDAAMVREVQKRLPAKR